MITASYFRQKAQECMQLSYASPDEHVATKLVAMAEEFMAKADELDTKAKAAPSKQQKSPDDGIDRN